MLPRCHPPFFIDSHATPHHQVFNAWCFTRAARCVQEVLDRLALMHLAALKLSDCKGKETLSLRTCAWGCPVLVAVHRLQWPCINCSGPVSIAVPRLLMCDTPIPPQCTAPKYDAALKRSTKHWEERHDRALLKGLLEHGYGKWSRCVAFETETACGPCSLTVPALL